jgi:hypothetical protein
MEAGRSAMTCASRDCVPVSSGRSYRVVSPPANARVTRQLANELEKVLEQFALEAGFDERHPVSVYFKPGIFGHHRVGRAADLYAVGGVGVGTWRSRWEHAQDRMRRARGSTERRAIGNAERTRNLGWRLYKAMQVHGRWAQPYGYPIQLFGPWTREEGPWKYISNFLLRAHRDHIHAAR